MSRRTRTGMTVDDEFLLGDEYDTDLLQSDSLTSQILASKDPTVAALMKQQKAKTQFELKKQGAIFGGIDLLATGLTAAISPTLREAGRESKRIQAQKRAGTLGAEAFKETLRQSKAIVGGAETADGCRLPGTGGCRGRVAAAGWIQRRSRSRVILRAQG